ncbi:MULTISPECIES: flavodoxin [unclassified Curtobacterium]|uniref:flavodoxin n=1 Tax=unclassified Curtobacterium TaxID=257496 RepID=UPI0039AFB3B2
MRIRETEPYSDRYDPTVQRNVEEQQQNARPGITGTIPDLADYDTVLIGSPIWNVRPPMIMSTFLEAVDVTGKRVLPFVTYAVSGAGNTTSTYRPLTPNAATLGEPLAVRGEDVADAAADVERWIRDNRI